MPKYKILEFIEADDKKFYMVAFRYMPLPSQEKGDYAWESNSVKKQQIL